RIRETDRRGRDRHRDPLDDDARAPARHRRNARQGSAARGGPEPRGLGDSEPQETGRPVREGVWQGYLLRWADREILAQGRRRRMKRFYCLAIAAFLGASDALAASPPIRL